MPKFILIVRNIGETRTWEEPYDKEVPDPYVWAKDTIQKYNATLRPHEKARELVDVTVQGGSQQHTWEKTNLVTIVKGSKIYDTCRCTRCGITAKKFGLGNSPIRDPKYKLPKFALCILPDTLPFGGVPSVRKNEANGCKSHSTAFFRKVAEQLGLTKEQYDIRYNACGDWGETTFHTDTVYLHVNFDTPYTAELGVLGRTVKGRKDYTGGHNQWLTVKDATLENVVNFYKRIEGRT